MTARMTDATLTLATLIGVSGIIAGICGAPMSMAVALLAVGLVLSLAPVVVGS